MMTGKHITGVLMMAVALSTTCANATIIEVNGISVGNNDAVPLTFGSNLSSDTGGATVSNGATPDIALIWAGSGGGWDAHGGNNGIWAALDPAGPTSSTPTIAQMEYPTAATPMTVTFTVATGKRLVLNSVDIGMATDKTDTYYFDVTISEVGGAEVFSTLTAAMDGDGGSGVQALTVTFNFTGTLGTDYVLAFNDVDSLGDDTISNNGGGIDNLSFNQASASVTPFTDDFEGFANQTDIDGANGWDTVDVGTAVDNAFRAVAQNAIAAGGSLSAVVTNTDLLNNFSDNKTNLFVQFSARPYFGSEPDVPAGASVAFYVNSTGTVIAYSSTVAIALNNQILASNTFATFVVGMNYNGSTYDLFMDGNKIADDFDFYSGANTDFNAFMVRAASGTNSSYLDSVNIAESNPFFEITNAVDANPNVELFIGDASIGGIYEILSADNDGSATRTLLTTATNLTNPFFIIDPNVLTDNTVTSRYYQAVDATTSTKTTNSGVWVLQKQNRGSNTWHAVATPSSFAGGTNSDSLHETLGNRFANALTGTASFAASDQLWFWNYAKNDWTNAHVNGAGEWTTLGGFAASNNIPPSQGLFVKTRGGLLRPQATNSIMTGVATTNTPAINLTANKWILFAWPFIEPAFDNEGTPGNQGWGFAARGGTKATTDTAADRIFAVYKGVPYDMFLSTNDRWTIRGTAVQPNIALEHGQAYFYFTRGTNFAWQAIAAP